MRLKKEFLLTNEEKKRVQEIGNMFFENDSKYLRESYFPKDLASDINLIYYKYLGGLQYGFFDVLEIELNDLGKDKVCKNNKNKKYWVKTYLLEWLANCKNEVNEQFLLDSLTRRDAYRILISKIYEV